ncbi:MAG: signal peptidase I [Fibromonadaceae bacterium]|jgi:signal peptidase I|nr:signal peptidase I [Fibromonadaceae bacterium]
MKLLKVFVREFAIPIATALVVIALAIQAFKIPTGSMENTLYEGDFLLGLKFVYGVPIPFTHSKIPFSKPKVGDVVIFRYPGEPEYPDYDRNRYTHLANALMFGNFFWDSQAPSGSPKLIHYADGPKDYIKRCMAKSGQTIALKDGKFFLDGAEQTLKNQSKYTEKVRGNSPRDYLKTIKVPEPGETISFDTLSIRDLWWIRSLMIQEMPDSLVEFRISLSQNGQELQDYVFEDFRIPVENHKYLLINTIFNRNHIVPQGLRMGDTISGEVNLNFFRKFARTGFLTRYNPNVPQEGLFGSRLVGYDSFDGSQLEDLEANVLWENTRLEENSQDTIPLKPLVLKWQVTVNGKPVQQYTVRDEVYFMMGDNRDNSLDGRYWGFVSSRNIKAKAFIIYYSLEGSSKVELLKPWTWIYLPVDIRWSRIARIIHMI